VVTVIAIITVHARYFGSDKNPVTRLKISYGFTSRNHLPANLVPGYQRRPGKSVPFDDVAAANPAGNDFHEYFKWTGLRLGYILDSNIGVVVPSGYLHFTYLKIDKSVVFRINGAAGMIECCRRLADDSPFIFFKAS
jgi:hypothetical protein